MKKEKWILDPEHSTLTFKVRHLMISTVTGTFKKFKLEAETEGEDFHKATSIKLEAEVNSLDTNNSHRDHHLKSADFFDSQLHPLIRFTADKIEGGGEKMELSGDLTIKGITQPVRMELLFGGITKDPYGITKAGFSIEGKINRKEFGLLYSAVTETGSIVVGDEVRFSGEIQLVKQE